MKFFSTLCIALLFLVCVSCKKKSDPIVHDLYMHDSVRAWVPVMKSGDYWEFTSNNGKTCSYTASQTTSENRYSQTAKHDFDGIRAGETVNGVYGQVFLYKFGAETKPVESIVFRFGNFATDYFFTLLDYQNMARNASVTIYGSEFNTVDDKVFSTRQENPYSYESFTTPLRAYQEVVKVKSLATPLIDYMTRLPKTIHEMWFDKKHGLVFFKDFDGVEWTRSN